MVGEMGEGKVTKIVSKFYYRQKNIEIRVIKIDEIFERKKCVWRILYENSILEVFFIDIVPKRE